MRRPGSCGCFHGPVEIALHRLSAAIDNLVGAQIASDPLQAYDLLARVPKLVRHHDCRHQEETIVLNRFGAVPEPLNMGVNLSSQIPHASLFALAASHPETAPIYDDFYLG